MRRPDGSIRVWQQMYSERDVTHNAAGIRRLDTGSEHPLLANPQHATRTSLGVGRLFPALDICPWWRTCDLHLARNGNYGRNSRGKNAWNAPHQLGSSRWKVQMKSVTHIFKLTLLRREILFFSVKKTLLFFSLFLSNKILVDELIE